MCSYATIVRLNYATPLSHKIHAMSHRCVEKTPCKESGKWPYELWPTLARTEGEMGTRDISLNRVIHTATLALFDFQVAIFT